jgi:hypothetical protein
LAILRVENVDAGQVNSSSLTRTALFFTIHWEEMIGRGDSVSSRI